MELRNLRAFVTAARLLNFTEAAKELCITQSTFSQTIKQLEDETGYALFFRNSHEVQLTEAGIELLPYAERAIHTTDDCTHRMEDLRNLRCGQLSIGITHSFNQVLHETLREYMRLHPGISLNIVYKPMTELIECLQRRELDFVLSFRPAERWPGLESHILFEDHLSVIVKADHPLALRKSVTLGDLAPFPAALPSKGLQARKVLDHILADSNINLNVRLEINEVTPLLRLVRNINIYTVLSSSATEDEPDLKAVPIDHPGCHMEGSVIAVKDRYVKTASREFIRILSETSLVKKRINAWLNV